MVAATYCGKLCDVCTDREELRCPGCKVGPGRLYGGDCALAKCCRDKGHQECQACHRKGGCHHYRSREYMSVYRRRSIAAQTEHTAKVERQVPFFRRWLQLLLWLVIPSTVASSLISISVSGMLPVLALIGWILGGLCALLHGVILLRLASEEAGYRAAGIYSLLGALLNGVYLCLGLRSSIVWVLVFTLATLLATTLSACCEMISHGAILSGWDDALAQHWSGLRSYYLAAYFVLLIAVSTILIAPSLGLGVMGIGAAVLSRTEAYKTHYLLRTLQAFQRYPMK